MSRYHISDASQEVLQLYGGEVQDAKLSKGFAPDFLRRPVALMDCMRLSLRRAAHEALASRTK
jgi:hypothetical protein